MDFIYSNRILVVDDDADTRLLLEEILSDSNFIKNDHNVEETQTFKEVEAYQTFKVKSVGNAEKALEHIKQGVEEKFHML